MARKEKTSIKDIYPPANTSPRSSAGRRSKAGATAAKQPLKETKRVMMSMQDNNKDDSWLDWKPVWSQKKKETPHDYQERHSPTEGVALRLSSTKEITQSQRRIVDARLWDAMEPAQQRAAAEIALAFETMGRGLGYIVTDWKRIPGAGGPSSAADMHSRLINCYIDWTKRCHRQNISHSMIVDILVFGFSCKALDRDRRVKTGFSRENLMQGLILYSEMKGWMSKPSQPRI